MFYEEEQMSMFAPDTQSGKTFRAHCQAPEKGTQEKTSQRSLKSSSVSQSRKLPLFLCLRKDGPQADVSSMRWENGLWPGEFSMHSFGEHPISLYHNGVGESHLSQILEDSPHPKYSLSAKACQGILNRANRRGKKLPEMLEKALVDQSLVPSKSEEDVAEEERGPSCGYPGCNQGGMAVVQKVSYSIENHPADSRVDIDETGKVQTLTSRMGIGGGNVPMVMESVGVVSGVDCRNGTEIPESNITLQSSCCHNLNSGNVVRVNHIVRRLTPLECERLQGFPDNWTNIGEWVDSKGKKHKEADSPRYKALGNSIALPPWKWVLKRLCACYERDATMASLFDGIGGFPYIWEQLNGKGSCLWASEIEEFPMAVTKLRFGE